ncbi:hypothetical protein ASPZODRAFT_138346 [Penicilliopsis zonata CBS 506.65]|uniref:Uncharacterized protein n=1 Tax=Penicilliopsis zonata CBS 506.65 TaxID=1073090 RepID=A0A1L9SVM2_9EURO|nr:hypothetical protein ASPZODRAFT_138346 [Penicilliopsis zonata CBS 506.65]OJJ51239.1 hypothetical protein ASPZODRAFT_138346 [Penicilliopsis zonata CBS 506.65]
MADIDREKDYLRFKHGAAVAFVIASPILLALPPRKLDHLAVLNIGAFAFSTNYLVREHTGRSIVERIEGKLARPQLQILRDMPTEKAEKLQAQLRAERDAQISSGQVTGEDLERLKARQAQEKGVMQRLWMGGEQEGWKERRLQEEQQALDEGKGYGYLIKKHFQDVWRGQSGQTTTDQSSTTGQQPETK